MADTSPRRLARLPLQRRDAIGAAYHVLTFDGGRARRRAPRPVRDGARRGVGRRAAPAAADEPAHGGRSALHPHQGGRRGHAAHGARVERRALQSARRRSARPGRPCPPGHRPVLVAGGVGVAPLLFLARELAAAGGARPLALYGGRTAARPPARRGARRRRRAPRRHRGRLARHARPRHRPARARRSASCGGRTRKVYTCGPERDDGRRRAPVRSARRALRGLARDADGVRLRRLPRLPRARGGTAATSTPAPRGRASTPRAIAWSPGQSRGARSLRSTVGALTLEEPGAHRVGHLRLRPRVRRLLRRRRRSAASAPRG